MFLGIQDLIPAEQWVTMVCRILVQTWKEVTFTWEVDDEVIETACDDHHYAGGKSYNTGIRNSLFHLPSHIPSSGFTDYTYFHSRIDLPGKLLHFREQ